MRTTHAASLSDAPSPAGLTETLANLNILWILAIVAGLTVLRLAFVYLPSDHARSFAEILESGMIAVALVFLIIRPFVLQAFFIPSPSMEPTLLGKNGSGDRILVNKFGYRFGKPQHDDVVVFLAPPAAMEGDPGVHQAADRPARRQSGSRGGRRHHQRQAAQPRTTSGRRWRKRVSSGRMPRRTPSRTCRPTTTSNSSTDGVMADNHLVTKERLAEILHGQKDIPVTVHARL